MTELFCPDCKSFRIYPEKQFFEDGMLLIDWYCQNCYYKWRRSMPYPVEVKPDEFYQNRVGPQPGQQNTGVHLEPGSGLQWRRMRRKRKMLRKETGEEIQATL